MSGGTCHAKSGPGQNQSPPDHFWLPKLVQKQILAAKSGPGGGPVLAAKSGPGGGPVLAAKSGPGPGFGSQMQS